MSEIAILGGTGALGSALAHRWARAGHTIWIGSRSPDRAAAAAKALRSALPDARVHGTNLAEAASRSHIVVIAVPYTAHEQTLAAVLDGCSGKIVVDTTVPLRPPKVGTVQLPEAGCAALEAQELLGKRASVVSALQTVSAVKLSKDEAIDCDVLVSGDNKNAVETVLSLIVDLGLRGFYAGPLANSAASEALTSVLIQLNRKYFHHAGIKVTGEPRDVSKKASSPTVSITPVRGLPLIQAGDDLGALIGDAINESGERLQTSDVIVVAQKIISKAEDRAVRLADVAPSGKAKRLADESGKDPRIVQLMLREAERIMRVKPGVVIARHRLGHVAANAGIDVSNLRPQDDDDHALLWPEDPDTSAQKLRNALQDRFGVRIAVIISDSLGRAWRMGTTGIAIGSAGIEPLIDRRGEFDLFGRTLQSTVIARADEIAAAASLVIGEANEGTPIAILRGVPYRQSAEAGIASILRPVAEDLFP